MFSKLKSIFSAKGSKPSDPAGKVTSIFVAQEAVDQVNTEPYALVQSVIDYVNAMTQQGKYWLMELPEQAVQAYYCDYYLAQVNNGGHSQFIHNSAMRDFELTSIDQGLQAMGAYDAHKIFADMMAWANANPQETAAQTGFTGGRAEYLDQLDKRFYALEKDQPMITHSGRWLAQLDNLTVVPKSELGRVIGETAKLNPHLHAREMAVRASQIQHFLTDGLHGAFGYAANRAPDTLPVHALGAGSYYDIDGKQEMAFGVGVIGENLFGVRDDDGVRLYTRIEPDNPKIDRNDPEDMKAALSDGRMAAFKAPEVGPLRISIPQSELAQAAQVVDQLEVAAALDLLLRFVTPEPKLTHCSVAVFTQGSDQDDPLIKLLVLADSDIWAAVDLPKGAALLKGDERIAQVARNDISAHAKYVKS